MPSAPSTFRQPSKGLFRSLWDRLLGKDDSVPELAREGRVAVFLDAAQLAKRYRVTDRAINDGRQNKPLQEATELTGTEAHLQSECNKALKTLKDEVRSRAARSASELDRIRSRLKLDILNSRLEEILRNARTEARSAVEQSKEELKDKKKAELDARAYYNWVRKFHDRRKAPSKLLRTRTVIAVLGISIIIETIVNADAFSLAGGTGQIGGASRALLISLVNVLISYSIGVIFGRMCYYIWKRAPLRKVVGLIVTSAWVTFLFPAHLFVAHWRDYLVANEIAGGDLPFDVVARLTETPFELQDLSSWSLFLVGLFLGLFALFKGMRLANDPYPGYGAAGQALDETAMDVENGIRQFRGKLDQIEKGATESSEGMLNEFDDVILDARARLSTYDHLVESFEEARHQIEMAFITCIADYRRENKETRTHEAPEYFDIDPELDGSFAREFSETADILGELETERQYAARSIGLFKDKLQKELSKRRAELESYLGALGGIAKEELMREDVFFLEHGGAAIMPKTNIPQGESKGKEGEDEREARKDV
jgi:hypothetical protein